MKNLNKKAYQNSLKDRKNWQSIIPIAAFDNAAKYIIELESRVARLSKKIKILNNKMDSANFPSISNSIILGPKSIVN